MLLYCLVAQPPIYLVAAHIGLDLVFSVRIEEAARNAPWQNSQNLIFIAEIGYHAQGGADSHVKGVIEVVNTSAERLS